MKVKLIYKNIDSIIIEADTLKELREIAKQEMDKRGWCKHFCYTKEIE